MHLVSHKKAIAKVCTECTKKSLEAWREMYQLMKRNKGVGLAAPQIGLYEALFVADLEAVDTKLFAFPTISKVSEETKVSFEGCLSLPLTGLHMVRRHRSITVTYINELGKTVNELELTGRDAVIFQHEYDHLQATTIKEVRIK